MEQHRLEMDHYFFEGERGGGISEKESLHGKTCFQVQLLYTLQAMFLT